MRPAVHVDADDPVDRFSWALDETGRELIERADIRDQLAHMMKWPGRVSGWRRVGHIWIPDVASGMTLIFDLEDGQAWRRPRRAILDPMSFVGNASSGSPPALRFITLADRRSVTVVAAICTESRVGSLVELDVTSEVPGPQLLLEAFLPGRDPASGFEVSGERFDTVRVSSIYGINGVLGLETAVLLVDSLSAPRTWMTADHCGKILPTLGISRDNMRIADSADGRIHPLPAAFRLGEMRRIVRGAHRALSG